MANTDNNQPRLRGTQQPQSGVRTPNRVPEHAAAAEQAHEPEHEATHVNQRIRTRTRHSMINRDDPYYVNIAAIPPDTDVNWKRVSNVGKDDPFYIASMREQGWEPVNPKEHPDWVPVPPDYDKNFIEKGGLILMERPMALTIEARNEGIQAANQQVIEAEQRLGMTPKGEMTREHKDVRPRLDRQYMRPMAIEE
jgi:hypothetical protein